MNKFEEKEKNLNNLIKKLNNLNLSYSLSGTKNEKIITDKADIVKALVVAAKIREVVISKADKGLPTISTIFPIIFPIRIDDEV